MIVLLDNTELPSRMQRLLIAILASLLASTPVWAEDASEPPQKDLLRDTQQCTEAANTKVLETDGEADAEALFVECMTQRGYTEDELDDLEDQ
jgi:hypothetical protein